MRVCVSVTVVVKVSFFMSPSLQPSRLLRTVRCYFSKHVLFLEQLWCCFRKSQSAQCSHTKSSLSTALSEQTSPSLSSLSLTCVLCSLHVAPKYTDMQREIQSQESGRKISRPTKALASNLASSVSHENN